MPMKRFGKEITKIMFAMFVRSLITLGEKDTGKGYKTNLTNVPN